MSSTIPLVIMVVGALLFGLTSGKVQEMGKMTFFAGILAFALHATALKLPF